MAKGILLTLIALIVIVLGCMWAVNILDEPKEVSFPNPVVVQITNSQLEKENMQLKSQLRYYQELDKSVFDAENIAGADLSIRVEDSDGIGVENVRIRVNEKEENTYYDFFTDMDGRVKLFNLKKACYNIEASKNGFETKNGAVCLCNDRSFKITLTETG